MVGHQKKQNLQLSKSSKDLGDGVSYQPLQLKVISHTKFITGLLPARVLMRL